MAKGEKPIGIVWNMNNKRLDSKEEERYYILSKFLPYEKFYLTLYLNVYVLFRYTIREEILIDGVKSDLSIKKSERIDTAVFTCVATNSFGSDDSSIQLIVQGNYKILFVKIIICSLFIISK